VFEGNSWEIQSQGKRIWVELQSNDENCLIISLQVGKVKPPYSRERIWPPKINTPIMREYLITPYKETHNKSIDSSCLGNRIRSDLCVVRSIIGSLPIQMQGRHCVLNVNVPDPSASDSEAAEYSTLLGSKSDAGYYDLISESPNLVKTDGWLATSGTAAQKIERGARVLAIGWLDDSFVNCADNNKMVTKWTSTEGQSCPTDKKKMLHNTWTL
jgi:hypothetical protein